MMMDGKSHLIGKRFREKSEGEYGIIIYDYENKFNQFVVEFIRWDSGNPVFSKPGALSLERMSPEEVTKFFEITGEG